MIFFEKVYTVVAKIPKGRVATYGQIAAFISTPRASRVVGFALRNLPAKSQIPWQRVLNGRGMISIENMAISKAEQARCLQAEGIKVKFKNSNYWVDLGKYLWKP